MACTIPRCGRAAPWILALLVGVASPLAGAEDVVLRFDGPLVGTEGLPEPWKLLGHPTADPPTFTAEEDPVHGKVIRVHAKGNQADAIYRTADVDFRETPIINFWWKVAVHPAGQVGTKKSDQAVKLQLDFGRRGLKRRVLSYVYDPKARVGQWHDDSSFFAQNPALVVDSGDERLNVWIPHSRDVREDYRRVYRSEPPRLRNVSIFCDSNDSDSEAIGYCATITFSGEPLHGEQDAP